MERPDHHIFLCASFRAKGDAKGVCKRNGAGDLMQYLQSEISDRSLNVAVSLAGCFNVCAKGPAMVIYPQGVWYGELTEDKIDTILDAMEDNEVVEEYELT